MRQNIRIRPDWWGDVARAKQDRKRIVVVSQGTVETNLEDLLLPTLEALKGRDDVLVIASTVVAEPDETPGYRVRGNARVTKFVPYDLLLPYVSQNSAHTPLYTHDPQVDVLVNNGGYGAVMTALSVGVPMVVAGAGQDKLITNNLVQWTGVGINLGDRAPGVQKIRAGIEQVLDDSAYKEKVVALSKELDRYDIASVFDRVIQSAVRDWETASRTKN